MEQVHLPTRTLVASGSSASPSAGVDRSSRDVILSRRVSLINEPLKPTRETPTMTVTKESHLEEQVRKGDELSMHGQLTGIGGVDD